MTKKEQIISTARDLFQNYGYSKVSMDEIAECSNVTKKTIYSYFKDKNELFSYFIKEDLTNMKKELDSDLKKLDPITVISKNIYKMLRFKKDSLLCSRLKSDIKKQKAEEFLKAYDDEILNYIELRINEWIKNKIIKSCDVHLVSFIIYKAYVALLVEYDEDIDEKKITKEITLILKDGLFN